MKRRTAVFSAALGLFATGCVTVPPYKREAFTQAGMDPSLENTAMPFHAHVHDSRQGATAGRGSTGGGCGCN